MLSLITMPPLSGPAPPTATCCMGRRWTFTKRDSFKVRNILINIQIMIKNLVHRPDRPINFPQ
jgi:hypothetical protein